MLHPHHGGAGLAGAVDEAGDAAHDGVAVEGLRDDVDLDVDDEQGGPGAVGEGGHGVSSLAALRAG